jgi:uncharacterized protein (TIGR02996 family)
VGPVDEDGLVRALLADPHDELARAAYADWLEEQGDALLAELMRLGPGAVPRRREIRAVLEEKAKADGFVGLYDHESVLYATLTVRAFLSSAFQKAGPELLRRHRITKLRLEGNGNWTNVGSMPVLSHVRGLSLWGNKVRDSGAAELARATNLAGLGVLNVCNTDITDKGLATLARSSALVGLVCLEAGVSRQGPDSILALAEGPLAPSLRRLWLDYSQLGHAALTALFRPSPLSGLVSLSLKHNALVSANLQALIESPLVANLRSLDLSNNRINDAGADALARSELLPRLHWLSLQGNSLTDDGWRRLCRAVADTPCCRLALTASSPTLWAELSAVLGGRMTHG